MSFYTFMMRKYKGTNTPEADLAYDMEMDGPRLMKQIISKLDRKGKTQ